MSPNPSLRLDPMTTMCQACGLEQAVPAVFCQCKICHFAFCEECRKSDSPSTLIGHENWCCKSCSEMKDASSLDPTSPYATPLLSPTFSLSSYWSFNSNYDDIPADRNPHIRGYGAENLDTGQKDPLVGSAEHSGKHECGSFLGSSSVLYSDAKTTSACESLPLTMEDISSTNPTLENPRDGGGVVMKLPNDTLRDGQSVRAGEDSDEQENAIDDTPSFLTNIYSDSLIWMPPEPEDMEDEMESVANNDEEDDYHDGIKWGRSSSLSGLNEDGNSHGYREEHNKAMLEAMNGQFKILVSRFLASEGISVSDGDDAESWLSIVTSLSWKAALLVKPDASEGGAMDPSLYVKVKCIGTGSRSQSQVIDGLVFKKNIAHKHMPTKFTNPRLLLLKGSLGHSAVGLSSFDSMEEENNYLRSITDMTENCHPNLVLVERSVSRDIQESLLAKGITLVYDMKLPRLERIAQCTGSQIIAPADILMRLKLKQCDSFHIEKFVEEHNSENGRRPTKTLIFFEGCPKPLGCTILLKGAHSDELKKIKHLMQFTVFTAYHLILETSFFADQRALSTVDRYQPAVSHGAAPNLNIHDPEDSTEAVTQAHLYDIPISDGPPENFQSHGVANNYETSQPDASVQLRLPGQRLSSVSTSLERFLGDGFLPLTYETILSYFKSSEKSLNDHSTDVPVSVSLESLDHGKEEHENSKLEGVDGEFNFREAALHDQSIDIPVSVSLESLEHGNEGYENGKLEGVDGKLNFREAALHDQSTDFPVSVSPEKLEHAKEANDKRKLEGVDDETCNGGKAIVVSDVTKTIEQYGQIQNKDDTESMLDPHSILVLFSSRGVTNKIVCEQSHLSRITYYGNFDMSLGRFLQDILLNQKHSCSSCGGPPDSHVYCYTHQNGKLNVLVRRLPQGSILPGEAEGKIWMWTRCLKCERESGIPKSTRRVVMSSAAHGLSFGKFLELSFSSHSATSRLSRCGHSLHRDSLRFFGLGSRVAMFRYSPVEIYAVCKPPAVLEFHSPNGQEWLKREANDVLAKGEVFFMEVAYMLQKLKPRYTSSLLMKSTNNFDSIKEFSDVEEMLMREKSDFESSLLKIINQCGPPGKSGHEVHCLCWLKQELLFELFIWDRRLHSILLCTGGNETPIDAINEGGPHGDNDVILGNKYGEESMSENSGKMIEDPIQIPIDPDESLSSCRTELGIKSIELSGGTCSHHLDSFDVTITEMECSSKRNSSPLVTEDHPTLILENDHHKKGSIPSVEHTKIDPPVPATTNGGTDLELKPDEVSIGGGTSAQNQHTDVSREMHNSIVGGVEGWIWAPFSELRGACKKDLHGGSLQKFEFIHSYSPGHLSPLHQLITQETKSLNFLVGPSGNIISVSEDDISSMIACALALSEDWYCLKNIMKGEGKGESDGLASSSWSSTGSSESDGMRSSISSDELSTSGSDGSIASQDLHPEIPLVGSSKITGKCKYSVVCVHAKQFYALRRRCCPSEMAYISSLSRCRKWDAQGGKSKAFFAKSMDDRFIIKQIKKTEFDSFLKFAPDYFKHVSESLDSGSQTCLAKILGIYQVRQSKGGKEVKTDLMVMENLLYGRNFSRRYDLKGAMYSRYVSDSNAPECVLLDQNFVEDMRVSPIYIAGKTKHLLQRAIWNDTSFLTSINVMDYSLLVGVDKQRHELVFGIIDYLRQYTLDKQVETWVKSSLVVPRNESPTVISPKEYKKRFRKFMTKYFLTVPDSWIS